MATRRTQQPAKAHSERVDCATFRPEFILAAGKMGVPVVRPDEEERKREFEGG